MKTNKVLFGLFAGLLALAGGTLGAQNLYEIGPDNVGGPVSSLIQDHQDASGSTIYAGATNGGLFVKSNDATTLRNLYQKQGKDLALANDVSSWHYVPYVTSEGLHIALPISCMVQGSAADGDNTIYIGTGSTRHSYGTTQYSAMSRKGMGIYCFDASKELTEQFEVIPGTEDIDGVNDIDYIYRDGKVYLFVATNSAGLRRIVLQNGQVQSITSVPGIAGNVRDVQIIRGRRTGYFSKDGRVYRIGDVTRATLSNPVDVTSTNAAFGSGDVLFAVAPSNNSYLYAMVIGSNGYLQGLYLTTNEQTWHRITSSTVMPFYGDGFYCGAITVDPANPRHVVMAGQNVWVGEGYSDDAYYIWTQLSSSETMLNGGNYMTQVMANSSFVHSGIQQVLYTVSGNDTLYYIATDGGVFSTRNFYSYQNTSHGLNNVQITGLAVAADGTLISGANGSACPLIETVNDLNITDVDAFRTSNVSWYDNGSLTINHNANVVWYGDGAQTAASSFQQVLPTSRRVIFTSSANAKIGRAYTDYLDFTNTTTWTSDTSLLTNQVKGNYGASNMYLWESDHDTIFKNSVTQKLDTLGFIYRKVDGEWTKVWLNDVSNGANRGSKFHVLAGDSIVLTSRGHADYPFGYVVKEGEDFVASTAITVKNPIQARMVITGEQTGVSLGSISYGKSAVWYSWQPTDFTRVWDATEELVHPDKCMFWAPVLSISRDVYNLYVRNAVISNDGVTVYASAYVPYGKTSNDPTVNKSMLFRISGFENIDFSNDNRSIQDSLVSTLTIDTIKVNGSVWFDRPISSIAVDPREGQDRIILTFERYSETGESMAIVENASGNYQVNMVNVMIDGESHSYTPAYSALVEQHTGNIYLGTSDGLFVCDDATHTWTVDSALYGVPVTAICQQTKNYPIRRHLGHTGITADNYVFAKTKWPGAIYFGTYGRGIFMDMSYVTDFSNDIAEASDFVDIPTVHANGVNNLMLFPNPVVDEAHLVLNAAEAGKAALRVYDLNGRMVLSRDLGQVVEGEQQFSIATQGMAKGMYLINVTIGGNTATAKMIVR